MKRARKANPNARCCWVCGKLGGAGFTRALQSAGYDVPAGAMAYAHPTCMAKALKIAPSRVVVKATRIVERR